MYKGTHDGDIGEIEFVKKFNANKELYLEYISKFGNIDDLWMTRVTTKQISKLSGKKVFTRADCYLIRVLENISDVVANNDNYLSEDILKKDKIKLEIIPNSGVSIKMTSSKSYQILKVGPNSFDKLFGSYELGAGASLFCMRECELEKNEALISGWKTSKAKMSEYFNDITDGNENFYLNQELCKKIKNYSCVKIYNMINESNNLQKEIFNGIGLYEEPYTAYYFYHGDEIKNLATIPFNVTTGSGRTKGDYTIVLKPI